MTTILYIRYSYTSIIRTINYIVLHFCLAGYNSRYFQSLIIIIDLFSYYLLFKYLFVNIPLL